MENVNKILEGLTFDEIEDLVNAGRERLKNNPEALKQARKDRKANEKAQATENGKNLASTLSGGERVRVIFKGEEVVATFLYLTDKRFTVEVNGAKRSIQFDKILDLVESEVEDADDMAVEAM